MEEDGHVRVWWQSEHDAIIMRVCMCLSSEKIALTRFVGLEYLLITWWIFFSRPLNRLQLSARGWGYITAVAGHPPTSDDHWKPPSTVCVRVCWNSWIRKWRVWCMSDWIQILSSWIQDMYWTGFKTWYIRSYPRYVSNRIQDMYQIGSKICIRLDPRYVSYWIQDMYRIGSKIWTRLDPRYESDWIQEMCQIGSKICVRLDPRWVWAHQCIVCLRLWALCRHQPSWHDHHVMSRCLMQMSKHAVKCDEMSRHVMTLSHFTGCLLELRPVLLLSFLLIFT